MNRKEMLEAVAKTVTEDRENQYGSPEDNFQLIAELWAVYMGMDFSTEDVAMMMCLLKIARIATGKPKADNYIDLAGYAACACEIATKKDEIRDCMTCKHNLSGNSLCVTCGNFNNWERKE